MSIQESLRLVARGNVALIEWDLVGEKVNKMSTPVMVRFQELIREVKSKPEFKALILISRKPNIFIAGADIEEIKNLKKKEDFRAAVDRGHQIFDEVEDLPIPVIAAIHGACLGGGCELVLACDYRIASDDAATRIGLPEVQLGIIPGFGGCVRMPRVIGMEEALKIILAGKAVDTRKALKLGLVDRSVHVGQLEEKALEMAQELIKAGGKKRSRFYKPKSLADKFKQTGVGRALIVQQSRKMVMEKTKGHYPAHIKALDVVAETYKIQGCGPQINKADRARAMEIEADGFCEVATTDVSRHLINVFFLTEAVKKKSGVHTADVKPLPVNGIGVLGAGTMGGGIAYVAADKGIQVRLKDLSHEALAKGFEFARSLWDKQVRNRRINSYQLAQRMNRVSGGLSFAGFSQLDVVIEAVVEDMKIKQKVVGETASQTRPNCIIATNTSSLSVTEMAKGHPHPENFVGMHFFNPVDKMPLVEVIRGEHTSDQAVATIFDLSKKMGKIPVVVKDGPGFIVNRLLMPYLLEALFLVEDGMSVERIDRAFSHIFGMPMGPLRLIDEIGIDVAAKVAKIFHQSLGERVQIPQSLEKLTASGRLGKKNKKGFYLYDQKGKELGVDPLILTDLGLPASKDHLSDADCLKRGLYLMINEAAQALVEEHIVETPEEVDLAMIMGTGFPPFRGGLLRYADSVGTSSIVDDLEVFATQCGIRFRPSVAIKNMAKSHRGFYP